MNKMFMKILALLLIISLVMPLNLTNILANSSIGRIYIGEGYEITYTVTNQWDNYQNVTVTIENKGKTDIENWAVKSSDPIEVREIYDAKIFEKTIFKNKGYNAVITSGNKVSFGYTALGNGTIPTNMGLCQKRVDLNTDLEAELVVENDWGHGFTGYVKLTNKSREDIEFFEVDMLTNFKIMDAYTVNLEALENGWYRFRSTNYNYRIPLDGSLKIGITAEKSEQEAELTYIGGTSVVYDGDGSFVPKSEPSKISFLSIKDYYPVGQDETIQVKVTDENNEAVYNEDLKCKVDGSAEAVVTGLTNLAGIAEIRIINQKEEDVTLTVTASNEVTSKETIRFKKIKDTEVPETNGFSVHGVNVIYWDFDANVDKYVIQRSKAGETYEVINEESISNYFIDLNVESSQSYDYKVTAIYNNTEKISNEITVVTGEFDEEDETDERAQAILDLEEDYYELEIMYQDYDEEYYITKDVELKKDVTNGSKVSWSTNMPSVVTSDGKVTRPSGNSVDVVLTAILSNGIFINRKQFDVTVVMAYNGGEIIRDMSWEDIEELNHGELPEIGLYDNDEVRSIYGRYTDRLVLTPEDAHNAIKCIKTILGIKDVDGEIVFDHSDTSGDVSNVFYFNQYHNGVKMESVGITVYSDKNGNAYYLYSSYIHNYEKNVEPLLSANGAAEIAMESVGAEESSIPELIIYKSEYEEEEDRLSWLMNVYTEEGEGYLFYICAKTGEVVYEELLEYEANYTGKGYDLLVKDVNKESMKEFPVEYEKFGKSYQYWMSNKERNIWIFDTSRGKTSKKIAITSKDGIFTDRTAVSAYTNAIQTYDFFKKKLKWKGFNNKNGKMELWIHDKDNNSNGDLIDYANASSNTFLGKSTLKFGDGNGSTSQSFAADLDIVAHEFTHSITYTKLGLRNSNFSGAISEAYSDIFGELVEDNPNWLHGLYVNIGSNSGIAIRNLKIPNNRGLPSQLYDGDYYYKRICDNNKHKKHVINGKGCDKGGVHTNCTIISYAAYLMYNNISKDDMAKIWFESYKYYNGNKSPDFFQCYEAVYNAARDLRMPWSTLSTIDSAFYCVNVFDFTVTLVLQDSKGNGIPDVEFTLKSLDKKYCDLSGSCCDKGNVSGKQYHCNRLFSCDPDTCSNVCCSKSPLNERKKKTDRWGEATFDHVARGYHRVQYKLTESSNKINLLRFYDDYDTEYPPEFSKSVSPTLTKYSYKGNTKNITEVIRIENE